jgi:ABC-type multidrug transport system fused ATPase/permease subunit
MKKTGFFSELIYLLKVLGDFRKPFLYLFGLLFLTAVAEVFSLGMVLPLLDVVVKSETGAPPRYVAFLFRSFDKENLLLAVSLAMVFLIIIKNLLFLYSEYRSTRFETQLRLHWMKSIIEKYMFGDFRSVIGQKQGVLLHNMTHEPMYASKGIRDIIDLFSKTMISGAIMVLLLMTSWKITALVFGLFGIVVFALWKVSRNYSIAVGKKKIALNQSISAVGSEGLTGIRQIKIFSLEDRVINEFTGFIRQLVKILVKFRVISLLPKTVGEVMIVTLILACFLVATYVMKIPVASLIPVMGLFLVAFQKLFENLNMLLSKRMGVLTYVPSIKLVHGLVEGSIPQERTEGREVVRSLEQGVRFRDVSFSHHADQKHVLFSGINLEFPKGRVTAIAGPSGSGKSTVCDLLTGFFRPKGGQILVDGKDLRDMDLGSWRRFIGYVSQEPFLFNATVGENIMMGKPGATEQDIQRAAEMAGAHAFIRQLPDGYATLLGNNGVNLSGGQRQRVALARALVRDPEVLILDEATSSLDSESEKHIQESIKKFCGRKTIILITHRVMSMRIADTIYVLDDGRVVEQGNYEDLCENRGLFWKLVQLSQMEDRPKAS